MAFLGRGHRAEGQSCPSMNNTHLPRISKNLLFAMTLAGKPWVISSFSNGRVLCSPRIQSICAVWKAAPPPHQQQASSTMGATPLSCLGPGLPSSRSVCKKIIICLKHVKCSCNFNRFNLNFKRQIFTL